MMAVFSLDFPDRSFLRRFLKEEEVSVSPLFFLFYFIFNADIIAMMMKEVILLSSGFPFSYFRSAEISFTVSRAFWNAAAAVAS